VVRFKGTVGDHRGQNRKRNRMRRFMVLGVVLSVMMAISLPAFAGKVHKEVDRFTDGVNEVIPAGEICDFPVGIDEQVKVSESAWFTAEDDLIKAHITVNGTTVWSGPGGSAAEHWSWSGWFDPETETFSQAGNVWNVHQNGLVIHDKGLIVFDDSTGDVLKVAGPHEVWFDGPGALCAAIG
jgi:hypothetical protein